jgi:ATP-dependent Lon protease
MDETDRVRAENKVLQQELNKAVNEKMAVSVQNVLLQQLVQQLKAELNDHADVQAEGPDVQPGSDPGNE